MIGAPPHGLFGMCTVHRITAALLVLIALTIALTGCRREARHRPSTRPIDSSRVEITAWLRSTSQSQQDTIELLRDLKSQSPARVQLRIVDIGSGEGRERWNQSDLESMAITINGHVTISWGKGDGRRTVSFLHPAGFAWTHEDLRAAVDAALEGDLRPADPAEAEGVRIMDVSVRGQSIRVGDEGAETGQLILQDQIVLEVTEARGEQLPGQRVSAAADVLRTVLEKPFTPNQLGLRKMDGSVALLAGDQRLLLVTPDDAAARELSPQALAEQWRLALREALIEAALVRPDAPEPEPGPAPPVPGESETGNGDDSGEP